MCIDFFQLITKFNLILLHYSILFFSFKFYLNCSCFQFDFFHENFKTFQLNSIIFYSTGSCFTFRIFNYSLSKTTKLKLNNQDCVDNSKSWITSFDYLIKKNIILLFWIDSKQDEIKTGQINFESNSLINISKLNVSYNGFGHFGRSLILDQVKPILYLSLPKLERIDAININTLERWTLVKNIENLGQIVLDATRQLIWIEKNYCIWTLNQNRLKIKLYCEKKNLISAIFYYSKSNSIFWLSNNGRIESLSLSTRKHYLILENLLINDKYSEVFFYTLKIINLNNRLIFFSSDIKHQLLRITSLQLTSNSKIFYLNESFVLLTDFPNIYDFTIFQFNFKKNSKNLIFSANSTYNNSIIDISTLYEKKDSNLFWLVYIAIFVILILVSLILFGLIIVNCYC